MKTNKIFANLVLMVAVLFTACSGMSDQITDVTPTQVTNIINGEFAKMTVTDKTPMIEVESAQLGEYSVTNKGSFAPTGNVLTAQVVGSDGQVSTLTITLPLGFNGNAEMTVNSNPAQLSTKGAYAINKLFTVTVKYSGTKDGQNISGTEVLECKIAHIQFDPEQNLRVVTTVITRDSIIPGDTITLPGDTVYSLVKVAPRTYVRQTAENEKDIIEMTNPGSFTINGTPKFENGMMTWTGSDGQLSTAKLSFASDTELSNVQSKVSANVVKLHTQVYRVDQTVTTNCHLRCSTEGYEKDIDTTLVTKISHYQADPTVPTETLTEYVTVYVDVPGETVYVHDTTYVDVPVPGPEVTITVTQEKEVYIYVPGKELFVYIDGGVANVKLDDEQVLEASLALKERKVEVEKSNLGKVELSNASALGAKSKSFNFDDSQSGTVSFSANGATVKSVEYDHFESKELRKDSLSLIKLFFKVTFKYEDVTVENNEVKSVVKERSFILAKAYVQKAQEEIVPVTYEPTLDWNISATATEVSLKCKVVVDASDGSFHKVYSWTAALSGLESYTENLYLDGQTAEVTDGNFTGVLTDEATEKTSKDGVWYSVKRNLATKDASKWMLENGTLVGPNNNINFYHTSLTCHLPNSEDIVWEVIPETVVDDHKFTNNNVSSFTLSDGRTATYWQTLNTGVHHYITIKVTYNGETETLSIPCLESKGNGKFLLCENTCQVNIFTTK